MWPEVARRNADAARMVDAYAADQDETLKRLSPEGAYDPRVAPLVQSEWEILFPPKQPHRRRRNRADKSRVSA